MKLLVLKASPEDWLYLKDFIIESASHHNEYSERDIESQLDKSLKNIKQNIQSLIEENTIDQLIEVLLETITPTALVNQYPQYAQGHLLSETVDNITGHFNKLLEEYTLKEAIAEFEGINSIPIMTIHKSKGLEYNTVIFIGLEDSAFWNFRNSQTEETRSFFVAFSRAKQRVIFTMSKKRPNNWGQVANQTTNQIDKLYELLDSAGIRRELIVTE
jgi:superfamily I DNA/RNA helicase